MLQTTSAAMNASVSERLAMPDGDLDVAVIKGAMEEASAAQTKPRTKRAIDEMVSYLPGDSI